MTVLDICRLIKHYWYIMVIIPIICMITSIVVYAATEKPDEISYTAKSVVVVNSQTGTVLGLAQNYVELARQDYPNITVHAAINSGTTNLTVTVVATDEHLAILIAEGITTSVVEHASDLFATNQGSEYKTEFDAMILDTVVTATEPTTSINSELLRNILIALVFGLFTGFCLVIVLFLIRRPILSEENVFEITKLPVLGSFPDKDNGARLLANMRFAAKSYTFKDICLISLGNIANAEQVKDALEHLLRKNNTDNSHTNIEVFDSLKSSMDGAYAAQKAQITVLVVAQWQDSVSQLKDTVFELRLASANVIGTVLVAM